MKIEAICKMQIFINNHRDEKHASFDIHKLFIFQGVENKYEKS